MTFWGTIIVFFLLYLNLVAVLRSTKISLDKIPYEFEVELFTMIHME